MRDLRELDQYRDAAWEARISQGYAFPPSKAGGFMIPSPADGQPLRCMVSAGDLAGGRYAWDHVSVSRVDRCPTWEEMDFIYQKFFRPSETVMQLHVPSSDHVNYHPYCLHLWRPTGLKKIPLPPSSMVGPDTAKGRRHAS